MNDHLQKEVSASPSVFVHAIATALPPHALKQSDVLSFMQRHIDGGAERSHFLKRVYEGSSIERRFSVLEDYKNAWEDFSFYPKSPTLEPAPKTAERNAVFAREAERLTIHASQELFSIPLSTEGAHADEGSIVERTGNHHVLPHDITHLITVSCTGFSAPGFDLAIQKKLLNDDVNRSHIGFMGCYAAFPALKLARSICQADPKAKVLIAMVELCTLHFQKRWEPDLVVANALFADGSAAMLLSSQRSDSDQPLFELMDFASRVIDGSEDEMAWIIGDTGFEMKLSSYVPKLIEANIDAVLDSLVERSGLNRTDIAHWAIHPGGRAILDRVGASLGLDHSAMRHSYEVLKNFGNMSSVTMCFVLAELAKSSIPENLSMAGRSAFSRPRGASAEQHSARNFFGKREYGDAQVLAPSGLGSPALSQRDRPAEGGGVDELVFAAAFGPGLTVESAVLRLLPAAPTTFPRSGIHNKDKTVSNGRQTKASELAGRDQTQSTAIYEKVEQYPSVALGKNEAGVHAGLLHVVPRESLAEETLPSSAEVAARKQPLFFPKMRKRIHEQELMDLPDINLGLLKKTIDQFKLLNKLFSAYRFIYEKEIFAKIEARNQPDRVWTVLDIGTGGGDIVVWLAEEARRRSVKLDILCVDQDERIVPWAQAAVAHLPEIEVRRLTASESAVLGDFDFVLCNHVMHHLTETALIELLRHSTARSRVNVVFNDLKRSVWAYVGYTIFTGLFVRKSLAYYDGRLSIRRGFLPGELQMLISLAGLETELKIGKAMPARLYISKR